MDDKVTVIVGGIRTAGAIVDTTPIKLKTNGDGAQQGSATCKITDPVNVNVSMSGQAGDKFTVDVNIDSKGDAKTKKGTLNDDFGFRAYAIPLDEFKKG
jgi:hypothetical protein